MADSWRWQLRDAEGQWVRMGSKVRWLSRGKMMRGTVVGSPRENYATVKPDGGGSPRSIDVRRMTVDAPTHAQRNPTVSVPPEVYAGERVLVLPADLKVGDWVDLPAEDALKPMDPNWGKVHHPAFVGQVTKIDPRGKGWIITVTGEGKSKRAIPATKMFPPLTRITPPQPKSDAGVGRPTRPTKAKVSTPAVTAPPSPQGTMEAEEVVKVKDAQPEAKSPAVKAAEKKALAVDTDTQLARNYETRLTLRVKHAQTTYTVQRSSGSKSTAKQRGEKAWDRPIDEALTDFQGPAWEQKNWERSVAQYNAETTQLEALDAEAARLNTIYTEAGGWTRAFLVTNQGGHVHRSMSCSTCRPTTRFHWLPEYSGSDESQIVEDAGERACTTCYPSAPVDVRSRPTKIFSEDERRQQIEREQAKAQRDAAKVAKAAKALTMPDGSEIRAGYFRESLRTEVSARQWYVRNAAELVAGKKQQDIAVTTESLERILVALAAKHSKTVEDIRAEMEPKVKAKVKQIA